MEMDQIAKQRIDELEQELDAQTTLNTILEAENLELRAENSVLREAVKRWRTNQRLEVA